MRVVSTAITSAGSYKDSWLLCRFPTTHDTCLYTAQDKTFPQTLWSSLFIRLGLIDFTYMLSIFVLFHSRQMSPTAREGSCYATETKSWSARGLSSFLSINLTQKHVFCVVCFRLSCTLLAIFPLALFFAECFRDRAGRATPYRQQTRSIS